MGRLFRRLAHRLLHGVADLFIELRSGSFRGLARLFDDYGGAIGGLLNDFLNGRFRDAVHRDLDGLLDGIVKLGVELLARHGHLFGNRLFGAAPQRLIQIFLGGSDHLGDLPGQRRLRIGRGRRWRHHMDLAVGRYGRCWRCRRARRC